MTGHSPPGGGDARARRRRLDDDQLLAAVRAVLGEAEPPPESAELAKDSFALRMSDAELATLVEDGLALTRGPTLTVFQSSEVSIEIELTPGRHARSWRVVGQLTPATPASIRVRRTAGAPAAVTADKLGRFRIAEVPSGPLSLSIEVAGKRPVVTDWIAVGAHDPSC
jgi:hypothetical protein